LIFEELKEIQRKHGYLPAQELEALARRTQTPVYRIHSVASFYPHFHLTPPARADVRCCGDMSCHLRGAGALRGELEQRCAGMNPGEVSFRWTSCLGQCDGAPAFSVNDHIYRDVTPSLGDTIIRAAVAGDPLPHPVPLPEVAGLVSDIYENDPSAAGYDVVRHFVQTRDADALLAQLKDSELRGMGGAGFPTAMKWDLVRKQPGPEKYVVCNADESEPGTIKDRFILTYLPHVVIEGMILAGLVAGAKRGIVYIRHEYQTQERVLEREIKLCYQQGLLGKNILGSGLGFDLEVFVSPGGYICGEESALLEAIEGKRAEPRNKPPFPVTHGLWNKPTVLNNVETFLNVPIILRRGVEWFRKQGRAVPGLKFVGVSGHVQRPGIYEVGMSTPARDVIMGLAGGPPAGREVKAWAPSGPSSGYLPASMMDTPLDFQSLAKAGSMLGSGAIVVCDDTVCMLDMALNATTFYRNESCGKCVPCRVGSQKLVEMMYGWTQGRGSPADFEVFNELAHALRQTSICGLGQVVPSPIASVIKHFKEELDAHFLLRRCPAGVCTMGSKSRPVRLTGRTPTGTVIGGSI